MHVLVADDDEIACELLTHTLETEGYDVESCSDGDSAAERLSKGDVRLVITDWEMPGLSGLELCEQVRRQESNGYTYIILLTSHGRRDEVVRGLSAGADDFVRKPFDPGELICRVKTGERILSLETREMMIFSLAKLAESRDTETGQHLERVQRYAQLLARKLAEHPSHSQSINAEFIRLIYLTSPMHDIGKVGIPDSVLLKPGRLSDEEFDIMKTHTTIGAETLAASLERYPDAKFLQMAHEIAVSHHERWDGRGYPYGIAGDQIPLSGRITAVADVYDALTSRRVYKDAFSHTVAKSMIVNDSGSHFDPDVVEAFLAVESQFAEIRQRFSETN